MLDPGAAPGVKIFSAPSKAFNEAAARACTAAAAAAADEDDIYLRTVRKKSVRELEVPFHAKAE